MTFCPPSFVESAMTSLLLVFVQVLSSFRLLSIQRSLRLLWKMHFVLNFRVDSLQTATCTSCSLRKETIKTFFWLLGILRSVFIYNIYTFFEYRDRSCHSSGSLSSR